MITSQRLLLRTWRETDVAPFAQLNSDPEVMAHFPSTFDERKTLEMLERIKAHFDQYGFGFYALERREDARFLGFVGLQCVPFEAPFTPAVEIGWRLAREFWGAGYASEAARAVLRYAFEVEDIPEVVSFTVPANTRSTAVMRRIGLTRAPAGDFIHPTLGPDHRLARHVLYRLGKSTWLPATRARNAG